MRTDFRLDDRVISYLDVAGPGPAPPRGHSSSSTPSRSRRRCGGLSSRVVPAGWRFIAPDLRGFGQSQVGDPPLPPTMEGYARDVVALLDHLRLDRVVVGGLSMGGYVAFALLRLAPERVAGLVLADTRAEADDDDGAHEPGPDGGDAGAGRRGRRGRTDASGSARRDDARIAAGGRPARAGARTGPAGGRDPPRDSEPEVAARLDARCSPVSTCPTLVVVGDEDQITTVDVARRLHARIPGAELAIIEQAGHLSNLEQPEAFNAALRSYLKRTS